MVANYKTSVLILICFVSVSLSACTTGQLAKPARPQGFAERLNTMIPGLLQTDHVPGVAVALIHNGEVAWTQGYGLADKTKGTSITADTVFQVGSIAKPVTAWGVMRLVGNGKLNLDEPVERYLTRWHLPASKFDHNGVTIRRLLSHTAGLSVHGYSGFEPNQRLPSLEESLSGATGGAGDVRVICEPGSEFTYSGGGYTLLQLIVEEVSGETFADYMQREVLTPLGMAHSGFELTSHLQTATAIPYGRYEQPLPNYLFTAKAAACLYTTISDISRFVAAAMPGSNGEPAGRGVLTPDTVKLMFTPDAETDGAYGLGYDTETLPNGMRMVSHGGANTGWRSLFAALPEKRQGIVILTNSENGGYLAKNVMCVWAAWAAEATPLICLAKKRCRRRCMQNHSNNVKVLCLQKSIDIFYEMFESKRDA